LALSRLTTRACIYNPNPDKPEPKTFKDLPQRHKGHQGTPRNIFLFVNLCVLCVLVVDFLPHEGLADLLLLGFLPLMKFPGLKLQAAAQ
jgi:hypothetical protein